MSKYHCIVILFYGVKIKIFNKSIILIKQIFNLIHLLKKNIFLNNLPLKFNELMRLISINQILSVFKYVKYDFYCNLF